MPGINPNPFSPLRVQMPDTSGYRQGLGAIGDSLKSIAARKKEEDEQEKLKAQMQMVTEYLADPKYKDKDGFVDASKIRTTAKSDLEPEAYQALMGEIDKMNRSVMEQDFNRLRIEQMQAELKNSKMPTPEELATLQNQNPELGITGKVQLPGGGTANVSAPSRINMAVDQYKMMAEQEKDARAKRIDNRMYEYAMGVAPERKPLQDPKEEIEAQAKAREWTAKNGDGKVQELTGVAREIASVQQLFELKTPEEAQAKHAELLARHSSMAQQIQDIKNALDSGQETLALEWYQRLMDFQTEVDSVEQLRAVLQMGGEQPMPGQPAPVEETKKSLFQKLKIPFL